MNSARARDKGLSGLAEVEWGPALPECKGLAACGHLFGFPPPSGQHLHRFCLDLKDHNELVHQSCPQMGIDAMSVTETDGVGVCVSCVARSPLVASLFFRLCPILFSKGHKSRVSNSGSGRGTWWFQCLSPSLSFVSLGISSLKTVWGIITIIWNNISGPLTPENFVGSDEGSVCNPLLAPFPLTRSRGPPFCSI